MIKIITDQKQLRKLLQEYIYKNGVTQKHIANKLGISRPLLCLFLKNERGLGESNQEKLKDFFMQMLIK